jgi:alcohol dehydrogenase (cytochrome c)
MEIRTRLARVLVVILGLFLIGIVALGIVAYGVPRYRWRAEIVRLKATGGLSTITWKELYHLNRHGDPFHLEDLAKNHSPYLSIKNPFASPDDVSAGERLFQSNCSFCHGSEGAGGRSGPTLKQRQMARGSSDWALFRTISNGIEGTAMPPSTLAENDRWKLVAYVKSISEGAERIQDSPLASRISGIAPVRFEDILAATHDPHQWLTYSGSFDGQRFSPNDQINQGNVSTLRLVWMHQYQTETSFETSPLVVDGFMFITVPPNRVEALDAKTGEVVWSYYRNLPQRVSTCCGFVNRGLAVLGKTLFLGTIDAHLVALDIRTGAVIWDAEIGDYKVGYSITSAPLVVKNMVITGVAGGEFGARGFVSARNPATGKEIWRFNTIPNPGEPGSETWEADALKTGGGPTWLTGTFDSTTNILYWPVGNPSPNYDGDGRKGDNLYTDCVVALDADSGKLRWYFQFTPHDQYDWDATEILVSFDISEGGKVRHLLGQANRNAFYYLLDRDTGSFITARPFAKQTWAKEIDPHGRPIINQDAIPKPEGSTVFPSVAGATNWMSPSYDPNTGLLYVPVTQAGGNFSTATPSYHPGEMFLGGASQIIDNPPQESAVRALDAMTGEMRWDYRYKSWSAGGVLSTRGGVVFGGLGPIFLALDAKTGRELWRVDTGGIVRAAPVTFLIDGKQFVTVAAGHDLLTFAQ